jgi:hypothetical protein
MRWTGRVACMEKASNYKIIAGKSETKRRFGSPGHRWEDNIKMYLKNVFEMD